MSPEVIGGIGLVLLLLLLSLRAPVGLAMLTVGVLGLGWLSLIQEHLSFIAILRQFKILPWAVASSYELAVIPMFVLMGYLCAHGNLGRDLFAGVAALGNRRISLAYATLATSAGFGAICGSSLATATTMGRISLPELHRAGYAPSFAAALLAAAGTLGILLPPSVVLVVYAVIVEASIIQMFQAALIPAVLAVVLFAGVIASMHLAGRVLVEQTAPASSKDPTAIRRAIPVVIFFVCIIGGLGTGIFTPTFAAALGVLAVFGYCVVTKRLNANNLLLVCGDTAKTAAMLFFLILGAEVLKIFFARSGLPTALADWVTTVEIAPIWVIAAVLVILLVLGCFMDSLSSLLVLVPFLWPALVELNGGPHVAPTEAAFALDNDQLKIWFGILCLGTVELGLITPPVGLNVLVIAKQVANESLYKIYRAVTPFIGVELCRLLLILMVPGLVLTFL